MAAMAYRAVMILLLAVYKSSKPYFVRSMPLDMLAEEVKEKRRLSQLKQALDEPRVITEGH